MITDINLLRAVSIWVTRDQDLYEFIVEFSEMNGLMQYGHFKSLCEFVQKVIAQAEKVMENDSWILI